MVKIGQQKDYFTVDNEDCSQQNIDVLDKSIARDELDHCSLQDELQVSKTAEELLRQLAQDTKNLPLNRPSEIHVSDQDSDVEIHVRGRPKSGRLWKSERKRASSIIKTKGLKLSLEKKKMLREQLKQVKEHSREIREQRKKEKEERRLREQENAKRKEENQKKSEIVQVDNIDDPAPIISDEDETQMILSNQGEMPTVSSRPDTSSSTQVSVICVKKQQFQGTMAQYIPKKLSVSMKRKYDRALIGLINKDFQPISIVEDKGFKNFMNVVKPEYKLPDRHTISNTLIPAAFEKCSTIMKGEYKT